MFLPVAIIAFILAAALGHFFGREIGGTTISGLKLALIIYPAAVCAIVGLGVFWLLGLGALSGLVLGLGGSLAGAVLGNSRR